MAVSFGDGDFLLLISSAASARVKFLHCTPRKPSLLRGRGGNRYYLSSVAVILWYSRFTCMCLSKSVPTVYKFLCNLVDEKVRSGSTLLKILNQLIICIIGILHMRNGTPWRIKMESWKALLMGSCLLLLSSVLSFALFSHTVYIPLSCKVSSPKYIEPEKQQLNSR